MKEERIKAATILVAMSQHCSELERYVAESSLVNVDDMRMRLYNEKYHLKLTVDFFLMLWTKQDRSIPVTDARGNQRTRGNFIRMPTHCCPVEG